MSPICRSGHQVLVFLWSIWKGLLSPDPLIRQWFNQSKLLSVDQTLVFICSHKGELISDLWSIANVSKKEKGAGSADEGFKPFATLSTPEQWVLYFNIVMQPNFLGVSKRKSLEDREGFQTKTIQGRIFVKGKKIPVFSLNFFWISRKGWCCCSKERSSRGKKGFSSK